LLIQIRAIVARAEWRAAKTKLELIEKSSLYPSMASEANRIHSFLAFCRYPPAPHSWKIAIA
jgi:hypothetical protein